MNHENPSSLKRAPPWPTREWLTADPASAGMDPEKLAVLDQIIPAEYENINGIVILRNGQIVFERYYHDHCLMIPIM